MSRTTFHRDPKLTFPTHERKWGRLGGWKGTWRQVLILHMAIDSVASCLTRNRAPLPWPGAPVSHLHILKFKRQCRLLRIYHSAEPSRFSLFFSSLRCGYLDPFNLSYNYLELIFFLSSQSSTQLWRASGVNWHELCPLPIANDATGLANPSPFMLPLLYLLASSLPFLWDVKNSQ